MYASTAGGGAMAPIETPRKKRPLTRVFLCSNRRGRYRKYKIIESRVKLH